MILLVVGTARISTLEKRNVDCMTEKLNIFNKGIASICHGSAIPDHVTSTGHNLKWYYDQKNDFFFSSDFESVLA